MSTPELVNVECNACPALRRKAGRLNRVTPYAKATWYRGPLYKCLNCGATFTATPPAETPVVKEADVADTVLEVQARPPKVSHRKPREMQTR